MPDAQDLIRYGSIFLDIESEGDFGFNRYRLIGYEGRMYSLYMTNGEVVGCFML